MSDTLIKVEGVSKKFCRSLKKSLWYGMQDLGNEVIGKRHGGNGELRTDEFWAVDDVSFELKRGECLGLIGRNGAGKTTLLRMLNGLIKPDKGRIEMRGQVGALIALGAGFNPILTGRENIYVNASVLGLSKKDIDGKLDEIIDFAGLDEILDSPVQTYSSGMQVRLGFAIATTLKPDILLLDEVLAVGDLPFRIKCYRKIDTLRQNAAVILVSHSVENIGRVCNHASVFDKGKILHYGDVAKGLKVYNNIGSTEIYNVAQKHFYPIQYLKLHLNKKEIAYGDELEITFEIHSKKDIEATFRLIFFEYPRRIVAGEIHGNGLGLPPFKINKGTQEFLLKIPGLYLRAGEYSLGHNLVDMERNLLSAGEGNTNIIINGSGYGEVHNQIPAIL